MADGTSIKVEGVREFSAMLKKIDGSTKDLSRAHKEVASRLVPAIASRTRRKSGKLQGAWKPSGTKVEARFINREVYAPIQEFGWPARGIEPTHASKIIEERREEIMGIYGREIQDIVDRHTK